MEEKPHMPTQAEIHALPRWAKVALLGRCVERMLPIIKKDWPDIAPGTLFLIASAGGIAAISAEVANETSASKQIDQTAVFVKEAENLDHRAAAHAIAVCGFGCAIPKIADTRKTTDLVVAALESVSWAFQGIGFPEGVAVGSVWPDYVKIRDAAKVGGWTNDTPVLAEAFGELWPFGPPPEWPEDRQ